MTQRRSVLGNIRREIQTITFSEGTWARSEFPHPLVTLDFDADGNLLAVSAPGLLNAGAVEALEKVEERLAVALASEPPVMAKRAIRDLLDVRRNTRGGQ